MPVTTVQDRPWGLPSLLYNGYRAFFPGVKQPERVLFTPTSINAHVKNE